MSKMREMIYAVYKGDTFLIADTLERVADYLEVKKETVKWLATPSAFKRKSKEKNGLIVIKFKEEEQ